MRYPKNIAQLLVNIGNNVSMNIYLDIDGVLLANESNAAQFADDFLQAVLNKYPKSTYWLTTHQWQGENRAIDVLTPHLRPETIKLLSVIKLTQWDEWKTDAIDFTKSFLWFDDDLYPLEREVLVKNKALSSWIQVDLNKNNHQLQDLTSELFG